MSSPRRGRTPPPDFMASLVANILSGNALSGLAQLIDSIRGKSPEAAAKLAEVQAQYASQLQTIELQQAGNQIQGQINVNQEESKGNWFEADWRPLVGYICGGGLAIQFIVSPLATWGCALAHFPIQFPQLDMSTLLTLLFGMLGLGGIKAAENISGSKSR